LLGVAQLFAVLCQLLFITALCIGIGVLSLFAYDLTSRSLTSGLS